MSYWLDNTPTNPDIGSLCATALENRENRGVTDLTCNAPPGIMSVVESSWGGIKAKYR